MIDDSVDTANGLRALLQLEGYDAKVAFDGEQGLVCARTFAPDIIVCDINLPRLDGFQLAQQLRAEPGLEHTKIVAITGHDDHATTGFDALFTKPLVVDELLPTLARLASR